MTTTQDLIKNSQPHWDKYIKHEFIQKLADGTLELRNFQHYLMQDYIYLFHYCRAFALAMYKSGNFEQMRFSQQALNATLDEIQLHINYCKEFGIDEKTIYKQQESSACIAYTRYVLDCGLNGDLAQLYAAVIPCFLGYAKVADYITFNNLSVANNPYQSWIDMYSSKEYQEAAKAATQFFEELCKDLSKKQMEKIQDIFTTATRMEISFWQMGLDLS
ncbi:thiaminase II [Arcobacter sp. s6]|jgi:thiaminase (transcriptional activator TenA)|uniref:thiaminase II n=1 Tax=Arcobacter sp. s6 TaxID=3230363 RepID=UPI0034A06880